MAFFRVFHDLMILEDLLTHRVRVKDDSQLPLHQTVA